MNPEPSRITRLFEAKEARRQQLAKLSFPEKVQIVVRMQAMAAPVLLQRGRKVQVWRIDGTNQ